MDKPPTADQVAYIIIEASKMTGADPIAVASGHVGNDGGRDSSCPRARAYAALALRELFPENGSVAIGRMVGAGTPKSYLSSFEYVMKKVGIPWWSDDDFCAIVRTAAGRMDVEVLVIRKPQAFARL